jgi:hypothetical protein
MGGLRLPCALAATVLLIAAPSGRAHDLGAECKLRGKQVQVEAYFDDDTPAGDARVRVLSGAGQAIIEGRTDGKGRWEFPAPPPGKYRVVVYAGAGHLAEVTISVPEQSQPSSSTEAMPISAGPARAEFTRFPWLKVAAGFGTIAGGAVLLRLLLRLRRRAALASPAGHRPSRQSSSP